MTKDNIIAFPKGAIKNKEKVLIDKEEIKKQYSKIEEAQTKKFVETAVDDLALMLCRYFLDLQIKTASPVFTRDLALLIDVMRGLIYRDFGMHYPSQKLVDEMVSLFDDKEKGPSARIDYARLLKNAKNSRKKNVFSKDLSQDLKDMKDNDGIGFEPDFDV
tara:strand:- start:260 stop:742 length:483 start_codon:yes stop_codon:yes gene_type:complete